MRMRERIEAVGQDLRYALRGLRRERGFTAVVVLTLALGIGANAAMFGVLDRLLLSGPAHVRDADQIRRLYLTSEGASGEVTNAAFAYVTLAHLRDAGRTMAQLAAYTGVRHETFGRGLEAEQVRVRYVTSSLFPLLGVRPALGRFLLPDDERPPTGELVAVLDHGTWQRRFGGDSAVLGRTIALGERSFTIVGVAPRGFTGPELTPVELWLPVSASADMPDWPTTQAMRWLRVIGRVAPTATFAQATEEATRLYPSEPRDFELTRVSRLSWRPLWFDQHGVEASEVTVSRWLISVSVVLLLVACANVANLMLARGVRRQRELAVRLALGAGRRRVVRLLLTEGALLAIAGGLAGVLVAVGGVRLLRLTLLDGIAWDGPPVDLRVLACAAAATVATALFVGLLPALRASTPRLQGALRAGTPQAGAARSRLRSSLTVVQAALSVVLLVGAGLFVQSLSNVRQLDIGVEPRGLLQVTLTWPEAPASGEAATAERERRLTTRDAAIARLRAMPGVTHAAAAAGMPFHSAFWAYPSVPGRDSLPPMPGGGPYLVSVSDDYFAAAGTQIVRGRAITAADVKGAEQVAVVNETMARALWPAGDAIGQCFHTGEQSKVCTRVVGVAEDTRVFELRDEPAMQFYVSQQQVGRGVGALVVRTASDAAAMVPVVRRLLLELDPSLTYADVRLLEDHLAPQLRPWRLGATVFALFGALALVVAAVGLYSVMAYTAAQRRHEMGVRLALGAQTGDVRRLVMRSGIALGAAGVLVGTLLALVAGPWAEPLLFDTSPRDPMVIGGVMLALLVVAALASAVPAWRVSRVAPSVALRAE